MLAGLCPGRTAQDVYGDWKTTIEAGLGRGYQRHHCGYSVGIGFPPSWMAGRVDSLRPGNGMTLRSGMTFHIQSWVVDPQIGTCDLRHRARHTPRRRAPHRHAAISHAPCITAQDFRESARPTAIPVGLCRSLPPVHAATSVPRRAPPCTHSAGAGSSTPRDFESPPGEGQKRGLSAAAPVTTWGQRCGGTADWWGVARLLGAHAAECG
ncbi:M24 family metallopeptidase [Streptomyces chartreusis]|uniref:M24 family metallopeptidase n=1 Tax=Streptomyces chartreusis TaxID=1969 RepID=UPI0036B2D3FE